MTPKEQKRAALSAGLDQAWAALDLGLETLGPAAHRWPKDSPENILISAALHVVCAELCARRARAQKPT